MPRASAIAAIDPSPLATAPPASPLSPSPFPVPALLLVALLAALLWRSQRQLHQARREVSAGHESEARFRATFEQAAVGLAHFAPDGRWLRVNQRLCDLLGYSREALLALTFQDLTHPNDLAADLALLREVLAGRRAAYRIEKRYRRRDGSTLWVVLTVSMVSNADGTPAYLIKVVEDIDARKQALLAAQTRLHQLAYHDPLTGLPNRHLLLERIEQAIVAADRSQHALAVCSLDLDDFRPVNLNHGRAVGDALLQAVGQRLQAHLQGTDTVARWGGDEFALLLTGLHGMQDCTRTLRRLLARLQEPYSIERVSLCPSASIGVALYPQDHGDADALLRHAEHAMHLAKQQGRNGYRFFDPATDSLASGQRDWLREFERALQQQELRLHYQPIVDMRGARVVGAEALVRWQHPRRGLLGPDRFLGRIDGTELMRALDRWVFEQGLTDLTAWQDQGLALQLHLNISGQSLADADLITDLRALLARHPRVQPARLSLEILESAALADLDAITAIIVQAKAMGLRFALDDFGTGYSSLTYCRRLPVAMLKIDRSFVQDMLRDRDDLRIVEAVVSLARAFDRTLVAEGVESEAHGLLLLRYGCDLGQGFGIARPMPAAALAAFVADYRQPARWASATARPWPAADLPLLTMEAEHRAWVASVLQATATPGHQLPVPLDAEQCRFGRWHDHEGRARYGHLAAFQAIDPLHRRIHALAATLVDQCQRGEQPPRAEINALRHASDGLIERLIQLQQVRQDPAPGAGNAALPPPDPTDPIDPTADP